MASDILVSFKDEDHTLGALLRQELLKNDKVIFAAYKIPHPLTPLVQLRIQTTSPATQALEETISKCAKNIASLQKMVDKL